MILKYEKCRSRLYLVQPSLHDDQEQLLWPEQWTFIIVCYIHNNIITYTIHILHLLWYTYIFVVIVLHLTDGLFQGSGLQVQGVYDKITVSNGSVNFKNFQLWSPSSWFAGRAASGATAPCCWWWLISSGCWQGPGTWCWRRRWL